MLPGQQLLEPLRGHMALVHRTNNKGHSGNSSLLWLSLPTPEVQDPFFKVPSQDAGSQGVLYPQASPGSCLWSFLFQMG